MVVPLYNEAAVIGDVVSHARRTFPNVVCVDDGSKDDSARRALAAGARLVQHPINMGQGAALQTGFEFAVTDPGMRYVVTFDADGQHQVDDVLQMLDRIRRDDLDVVFGSRFLDERTRPSALKRLVLRAAVAYTNLSTGTRLTDAHNGLRVLSRPVVERIDLTQNRMAHASEIVAQIGAMRLDGRPARYAEEPVHILYTDYSLAKGQSLWNSVNILVELMFK
nr:glycosyltransferase family 2 protein [Arsenicicoccus dermatophilus]